MFKAIGKWASESDERVRLMVILVWLAFGLAVVATTVIMALIMLPGGLGGL